MPFLLTVLLAVAVPMGGIFGNGSASATVSTEGQISVDLRVEGPVGGVVVAHLIDPGDGQVTVSMGEQSDGVFTGVSVVENANLVVVFEVLAPNGVSRLSDPTTLLELGVDPAVLGYVDLESLGEPAQPPLVSPENQRLLWAAGAATAAALALVAFWAAGPNPKRIRKTSETTEEE